MDIVGLDYSSRTATSYIINPAVGAPTRPESICQSINKMMKSQTNQNQVKQKKSVSNKLESVPRVYSKLQAAQMVDLVSSDEHEYGMISNRKSSDKVLLFNKHNVVQIHQNHDSVIQIDADSSFSSVLSDYDPLYDQYSYNDQTLNHKIHNLRIKDLMIIGQDQYEKKGIYSGIYKIKSQFISTKIELKDQFNPSLSRIKSKKEEYIQVSERDRASFKRESKLKFKRENKNRLKRQKDGRPKTKKMKLKSSKIYKEEKPQKNQYNYPPSNDQISY